MKPVNLIPTEQRRARASGRHSGAGYVVIGVLAALLVMAVAYALTSNTVNERRGNTQAAKADAARLEAAVAQRDAFVDFAAIKQARLVSVMGVAQGRFDWERLMRELARVMPAGSWLQTADASLAGDIGGESGSTAPTTTTIAGPAEPAVNLTGCTPHQSDVARMMVRLSGLHRVEDVKLNESTRETGSEAAATIDNCGAKYRFDLTATFTQQAPVAEAPRGAPRVPAALGGGS